MRIVSLSKIAAGGTYPYHFAVREPDTDAVGDEERDDVTVPDDDPLNVPDWLPEVDTDGHCEEEDVMVTDADVLTEPDAEGVNVDVVDSVREVEDVAHDVVEKVTLTVLETDGVIVLVVDNVRVTVDVTLCLLDALNVPD